MDGRIYLGTKRYSSWSLRGWLAVRLAGLEVEEVMIALAGGATPAVKAASPSGFVPYLEHRGARVWDSLAIAEYCAEFAPGLWPTDRVLRALARSMAAEMHSGFRALRLAMPMSLFRDGVGLQLADDVRADVARIDAIWCEALALSGGPFLFGAAMGAVDAMYAPVVARVLTYRPPLSPVAEAYCAAVRATPLMTLWYDAAAREPSAWYLPQYEAPIPPAFLPGA